jgi:NADPH:quinone reductase
MRAIAVGNFGDEPRLMELADPEPGPGEVLVAIEAASVNPMDWKASQGAFREVMGTEFPLVLGVDGTGRVEALGAGAGQFAVGDLVHGQFWGDTVGRGTFAERIAIAERPSQGALQLVPEGLEPGLAAAVPTAGMTAEGSVAKTGCGPGQTLLILGAAGGVGVLATQLAAQAGITVIATARGEAGAWIEGFGASETIDYTQRPVAEALASAHPDGIDAVLDLAGNAEQVTAAAQHVRDGGTVISTAFGVVGELARQGRTAAANYQLDDKPARLERVSGALAAGQLVIPVQDEVSHAAAAAAPVARRSSGYEAAASEFAPASPAATKRQHPRFHRPEEETECQQPRRQATKPPSSASTTPSPTAVTRSSSPR